MSLFKKITDYAKSPAAKEQAQELADKAKKFANDPKRKEEFESVKRKVSEKLGKDEPAPKPTTPAADAPPPPPAAAEPPPPPPAPPAPPAA
jgi:hypothetical protein